MKPLTLHPGSTFAGAGVLALVLTRFVLIVGTSIEGAALVVFGATRLFSDREFASLKETVASGAVFEAFADRRPWALAVVGAFLALFAAGLFVQFALGAQRSDPT